MMTEKERLSNRKYYEKNREKILARNKLRYKNYHEKCYQIARKSTLKTRNNQIEKIYSLLGSCCTKCGFSDKRALQIDHIDGNGIKDRKSGYYKFYNLVIRSLENNEKKYQILCANCNWIKRRELKEEKGRPSLYAHQYQNNPMQLNLFK